MWKDGDADCDHVERSKGNTRGGLATAANKVDDGKREQQNRSDNDNGFHGEQYRDLCGKCGARRIDAQIGLEESPAAYVAKMVEVFREVKRVLRNDGCLWLNLGDSYASGEIGRHDALQSIGACNGATGISLPGLARFQQKRQQSKLRSGLKPKDLVGIPWRVAFALQANGWYLRDAIVWAKAEVDDDSVLEGSAMPGSQRDRCTASYEFVFQLTKSARYYFDPEAEKTRSGAMLRNVWRINSEPTKIKHFATFPRELVRRCIRLGTSERGACPHCGKPWERVTEKTRYEPKTGLRFVDESRGDKTRKLNGSEYNRQVKTIAEYFRPVCTCPEHKPRPCVVFDPFIGSGTTIVVANALGRHGIGCDLSVDYLAMARQRINRPHAPIIRQHEKPMPLFDLT